MRIELLCFGTELLKDKVNTNSVLIARKLEAIGLSLRQAITVGDEMADILAAVRGSLNRSDIVFSSGGLGPTFDDLTRAAFAKALRRPLRRSPQLLRAIARRFKRAKLAMPPANALQADVIQGAQIIPNPVGTAPGQILKFGKKLIILLPGPPN